MNKYRLPDTAPFTLQELTVDVYRAPIEQPVRTSFGVMKERPAVIVTVRSDQGVTGWGEAWCNFPQFGAELRARYIESVLAPAIVGQTWPNPGAVYRHLTDLVKTLALQSGEPGPAAQAIAGVDLALWDMAARQAEQPLWRFLGGQGDGRLPTYASGLGPPDPVAPARAAHAQGHSAFKLKVGFAPAQDLANLEAVRQALGPQATLAVDANQAWTVGQARDICRDLERFQLAWLEEPIAADRPGQEWHQLAQECGIPLAGGENLRGISEFQQALHWGALAIVQPDITKWGGFSAGLALAGQILAAGKSFYPHFLGGGIGLIATAHLLAAVGGDGRLEVDVNPNPLRTGLAQPFPRMEDGVIVLSDSPGLGVSPDRSCRAWLSASQTIKEQ